MTVTPFLDARNTPMALVRCDGCAAEITIRAGFVGSHTTWGVAGSADLGPANKKLIAKGWRVKSAHHTCPACIAASRIKPEKEPEMTATVDPPRQPTPDQKHEIFGMLSSVYDRKAKRYQGCETDKTVAETLGQGILWGWVKQIREEFFGPDGNEAADLIIAEITEKMKTIDQLSKAVIEGTERVNQDMTEIKLMQEDVQRLVDTMKKPGKSPVQLVAK